jgi:hypothetical protein
MDIRTISASRIKTYDMCRYKYVLNYMFFVCDECKESFYSNEMAGMEACPYCKGTKYHKPEMKSNWGAEHGSALHEIIENYALAIRGTYEDGKLIDNVDKLKWLDWPERLKDIYKRNAKGKALYDIAKPKDVADSTKWCKGCTSKKKNALCLITGETLLDMQSKGCQGCPQSLYEESVALFTKYINRYDPILKQRKILGVETEFTLDLGLIDIHGNPMKSFGYIDLITELDSETIELIDHKFGSWVPTFEEFIEDIQVKMYSMIVRSLFPQYKEYIITFDYARKNPLSYCFEPEDEEKTKQELIAKWKEIAAPQLIRRTIIQGDGKNPDSSWKCKAMCDVKICNKEWPKFKDKFGVK